MTQVCKNPYILIIKEAGKEYSFTGKRTPYKISWYRIQRHYLTKMRLSKVNANLEIMWAKDIYNLCVELKFYI